MIIIEIAIITQAERDLENLNRSFKNLFNGLNITNTIRAPKKAFMKGKLA